jgi:hypothetical protein
MNTISSATPPLSRTRSASLSTFDDRAISLPFHVERASDSLLPGHELRIVDVHASPHGFRIIYRIDPVVTLPWAPWAEAVDEDGNEWLFMGGGYGAVEEADPPYTDGVVTTGPPRPQAATRYRVTMGFRGGDEIVLAVVPDIDVPW